MRIQQTAFLCFFVGVLTINSLEGQNQQKIDSLKRILQKAKNDSTKISIFKNLSWNYAITRSKLDSARIYTDSIRVTAEKLKDTESLVLANFYYGLIDRFSGEYYSGIKNFEKYVEFHEKQGDSLRIEMGLFQIGVIQSQLGNYKESLELYYRILAIYEANNMEKSIATALHSIGHIQRKLGNHENAIESYSTSISIKEKLDDPTGLAMSLASLGNTFGELKLYQKSEKNLLKALEIARNIKTDYLIGSVMENLGSLYKEMKNNSLALKYFKDALEIRKTLPSKKELASNLYKVGAVYIELREYDKAKIYLAESLELSKKMDAKPIEMMNYSSYKKMNELLKDYKTAYKFQNLWSSVKDSIFDAEKNKSLLELETKYEVAQKDKDIELLTKENELQEATAEKEATLRNALIGGIIALCIIGLLLFYTMRQRLKNQKVLTAKNDEINKAKLSEELQTLEMKALRAQMNPHFLFNSLNSINTMILSDENESASKYLSKFSKLVRLLLENSEQPEVSLKDEMDMLETYIQLESLRFNNKLAYKIDIDENIDQECTLLPSMVIQPFVENAIWHGLLHKEQKGLLTIKIEESEDHLHCSIIDNGVGREKSITLKKDGGLKKKSMGIKITTDRLKLLTKQKIKDVINIIDLKDDRNNALGTQVNIQIPLS